MTPWVHLDDVRDRARGAFLGFAVGDALGATVEFMQATEIRAEYGVHREVIGGGWLRLRPGRVTDDTEMSLCLARAIDVSAGWSARAAADLLVAWMRAGPIDVGSTCRAGIRRYMLEGTLEGRPNEWDAGNGAAMRMVPIALATLGDDAALTRIAVEQAHLTHNHPLSDAASVLVGRLIHAACLGRSMRRLRLIAEEAAAAHPKLRFDRWDGRASGYVIETLAAVLHCFFSTRSFEECVVEVVNHGGDADTTGAIAGAVAGAFYGPAELPRRWLKKLERPVAREVERLALRMVELSPVGAGPP
ncbi:MAG: ADP-ribosyl-[dinitrogen reductase] hydrolase [Anaeromyxobacteraceae bacterium]